MTQANANPQPVAKPKGPGPRPNIYTVLVAVTAAALLVGVFFIARANMRLTNQSNPFYIEPGKK
jgi:hypothetical protein